MDSKKQHLELPRKKPISVISGAALIIGNVIGSGIFISPTGVYENCGSISLSLIVWLLSGVISLLGALCYAELGTTFPESGAEYAYVSRAFGSFCSFLVLWTNVVVIQPCSMAIMSLTFGEYTVKTFFPTCRTPHDAVVLISLLSLVLLTAINCISNYLSMKLQVVTSMTKMGALLLISSFGFWKLFTGDMLSDFYDISDANWNVASISFAFYSGLFSYAGWNVLNVVTSEVHNSKRNLPLAIGIAMPLVTVLYMMTNMAYFSALSPGEILLTPAVAITFGNKVFGPISWVTPVLVAFSAFGSINGCIFSSGRLFSIGADKGYLPKFLAFVDPVDRIPRSSMIVSCGLAMMMLAVRDIYVLINYLSCVIWLFIGTSVIGMLYLRWKSPELHRPIKLNLCTPLLFIAACTFLVVVPLVTKPLDAGLGMLIMVSGVPVYLAMKHLSVGMPACWEKTSGHLTASLQKLMVIVDGGPESKEEADQGGSAGNQ